MDMDECGKDMPLLKQIYSRQIVSDCKAFANSLDKKELAANQEMNAANSAVRAALKESLDSADKYTRGECMVEYKKCMQGADACGAGWENCVFTIASENMQNEKLALPDTKKAKTKVATIDTYEITPSTMEILESKRYICERVLDSCMSVRQYVWQDFLREAAPTIKLAESKIESKKRQSCLTDISNCIQKACKDDIAGKGVETMDACLARPDMARSFCKVEIEPCEIMEPQIWSYVKDKLSAMRVDACTQEVKDCLTDENRCGKDYSKCVGMDFDYIHQMCPVDKLVVCKQNKKNFDISELDNMLMGLFLNIDNAALENCQNLVDEKMIEVCGSTTDCNRFAADEVIGTGSLMPQKSGDIYRITGMISFGSIKMGDAAYGVKDGKAALKPGEIGVQDYITNLNDKNYNNGVPDKERIVEAIEAELNNIAGTINRTIQMIEQDPKIQFCVEGRNLENINGKKGDANKTSARFPNLLNSIKMQIAVSALRKAQDNYNKKFTEEVSKATKNASADVAQYICQKIPETGSRNVSEDGDTELTAPYAISYEVSKGLKTSDLTKGGAGKKEVVGVDFVNDGFFGNRNKKKEAVVQKMGGSNIEITSTFNRETRTCHVCRIITTQNCKTTGVRSAIKNDRNMECTNNTADPVCEDIQM